MRVKGSIADAKQHTFLHLLKVPINDDNALHRLHFELSEALKNIDNSAAWMNPVSEKNIHRVMSHQGNYTSTNKKTILQFKKIIEMRSENEDEDLKKDNFAHKLLLMIDNVFKKVFFKQAIDKGCCAKRSPLAPATHWSATSEAASLRLS